MARRAGPPTSEPVRTSGGDHRRRRRDGGTSSHRHGVIEMRASSLAVARVPSLSTTVAVTRSIWLAPAGPVKSTGNWQR